MFCSSRIIRFKYDSGPGKTSAILESLRGPACYSSLACNCTIAPSLCEKLWDSVRGASDLLSMWLCSFRTMRLLMMSWSVFFCRLNQTEDGWGVTGMDALIWGLFLRVSCCWVTDFLKRVMSRPSGLLPGVLKFFSRVNFELLIEYFVDCLLLKLYFPFEFLGVSLPFVTDFDSDMLDVDLLKLREIDSEWARSSSIC